MRSARGFTLIEVLIAMAIVAVGVLAASKVVTNSIFVAQRTEDRTLGTWVASNRIAELRIAGRYELPPAGSSSENVAMGGRNWLVNQTISDTGVPGSVRIDVDVFADKSGEDKVAWLFTYLVQQTAAPEEDEDSLLNGDGTQDGNNG